MSRAVRLRRRFAAAVLQGQLFLAPATAPSWRFDPSPPPTAVLAVGAPVRPLR